MVSRSSFSSKTIRLHVTHWAPGSNSRETIECRFFQVNYLPAPGCNKIRLMVCLGLFVTLERIDQGGHPVLVWAEGETPGKEQAAGRGLKIQEERSNTRTESPWGSECTTMYSQSWRCTHYSSLHLSYIEGFLYVPSILLSLFI